MSSYVVQTLLLYECEKHPRETEWEEGALGDRIAGILMQLISCLQVCTAYLFDFKDLDFEICVSFSVEDAHITSYQI